MEFHVSCRIIRLFTILAFVILVLVYGVNRSASFLEVKDSLQQADAILVLGGDSLFLRTIEAVNLFKMGYAKHMIFTGCSGAVGLRNQDNPFVLKRKAVAMGVPSRTILVVTESLGTYSEIMLAKKIIEVNHFKKIIIVTSPFHQRRAYLLARKHFRDLNVNVVNHSAPDPSWNLDSWSKKPRIRMLVITEYKKIVVSWLLGWIGPLPILSPPLTTCKEYGNLSL